MLVSPSEINFHSSLAFHALSKGKIHKVIERVSSTKQTVEEARGLPILPVFGLLDAQQPAFSHGLSDQVSLFRVQ